MSNSVAAFYQIINTDALNHHCYHRAISRLECMHTHRHTNAHTHTHKHKRNRTPAHSHACTQSHSDVKAIGYSTGEANSWSWLLMATGSRGAGRDVDNDNVTPSKPALKNGTGHTHLLNTCNSIGAFKVHAGTCIHT